MRSPSGRFVRWAEVVAAARRAPGWVLVLPDSSYSLVKHIRARRHPDLRLADGELLVRARNLYVSEGGERRCDIDVKFAPYPPHDNEV